MIKDGFWDFWQISGRYAVFSKYHYFYYDDTTQTVCGIYPEPDNYQKPSPPKYTKVKESEKCKRCLKSLEAKRRII